MQIDGLEVLDAIAGPDGSYSTDVLDDVGNVVATVTRMPDGEATAKVLVADNGDTQWESLLGKVTGFLDKVAQDATNVSDEANRISNAAKGAVAGARIGYNGPINWQPWLIAGAAVVLAFVVSGRSSSRRG